MRLRLTALLLLPLLLVGCRTNISRADRFVIEPGFPSHWGTAVLFYIPSRLVDLLDVVHIGYGIGPGLGLEVQFTRPVSLGALVGVNVGVAWLGRNTNPGLVAAYARANASEYSATTYDTDEPPPFTFGDSLVGNRHAGPDAIVWRIPRWDIGVRYHALLDDAYAGFAVDEFVDFLAGWFFLDLKDDDFGH